MSDGKGGSIDITIVSFTKDTKIESKNFYILQDELQRLVSQGQFNIIMDFDNVSYVSSAGLGVLCAIREQSSGLGGDIKLINMSPKIRNLFDMLGFSRLFRIFADEQAALNDFV